MVDRTISEQGGSQPGTSRVTPDDERRTLAERSASHLSRLLRYARVELSAQEAIGNLPRGEVRVRSAREFLRARLAEEYHDVPDEPPTEAIFERLQWPTATAEHATRIERQFAEGSR